MNEIQVSFRSGDLTLEGLLANSGVAGAARSGWSVTRIRCTEASMHNNVVEAILAATLASGNTRRCASTFGAVGDSEGEHDGGPGGSR